MATVPLDAPSEKPSPQPGEALLLPSQCESKHFLPFLPPLVTPSGDTDSMWFDSIQELDSDLHWLLKLPHAKFWSQVVFDKSLQASLDSYLRNAPRCYDHKLQLPLKVEEVLGNIHRRVFMTFLRLSMAKESEDSFLCPGSHGNIIYEYYLFDITKLLDLCVLYEKSNKSLVTKMVANVFESQPNYSQDWANVVPVLAENLKQVLEKVLPQQGAVLLADQAKVLSPAGLCDVILYLSDTMATLRAFLDTYPPAVTGLIQGGFLETLVIFYESVVPSLQLQWKETAKKAPNYHHSKERFRQFKADSAWLIHTILRVYFDPYPAQSDSPVSLDAFIAAVTTVLSEKTFLREFEKHFSLAGLVSEMQQLHPELPDSHFDYIMASLEIPKSKSVPVDDGDAILLISQVKDLLPHLGEGFIELCLKEFDNNVESVIQHVLEDNLPPRLRGADQSQTREGLATASIKSSSAVMEENFPVIDVGVARGGVKTNETDQNTDKYWKRLNPTPASAVLNDKSHLDTTRSKYRQYDIEPAWSYVDPGDHVMDQYLPGDQVMDQFLPGDHVTAGEYQFDQYSDEYDDTYDSHEVGAADNDTSEDLFTVRRLNDKGKFSKHFSQFPVSDKEDEPPDHVTAPSGHVTLLQRPPQAGNHRKSNYNKERTSKNPAATGKPQKGGDARPADSERARQLKEKNKSKRANHNRKAMADKKRSKGMGAPPR